MCKRWRGVGLKRSKELIEAAVLVPVFRQPDGGLGLILVLRSPVGPHGGQIAFPGGRRERSDASLRDTALREAEEEIGIPAEAATVLTELPPIEIRVTGYRVHPFLGRIKEVQKWRPQAEEIAEVLEIPVQDFVSKKAQGQMLRHHPTWPEPRLVPCYRIGRHTVWGATYKILEPLIPRLLAREWAV